MGVLIGKRSRLIVVGFLICLIAYLATFGLEQKYDNMIGTQINGTAKIVSSKEEYKNKYIVKYKNSKFLLYTEKSLELQYGDIIYVQGTVQEAYSSRNFKLFDYARYLRQNKIYGVLDVENIEKVGQEKDIFYYLENFKMGLKQNLSMTFDKEQSGFLSGLLIGDKTEITEETATDFRNSSLSHILAISGMHIVYVSFGVRFLLDFVTPRQRLKDSFMIVFLLFFAFFTGGSPSCLRACIMCSMAYLAKLVYRENSFLISFLVSLDFILILNPYNIESVGLWLSYLSTLGLVYINQNDENDNFMIENGKASIACNIMIFPIICNCYNKISLTFLASNLVASFVIGPIIILGYFHLFLGRYFGFFAFIEKILIKFLLETASFIGNLPISKIPFPSIPIGLWIIYYILVLGFIFHKRHPEKKLIPKSYIYAIIVFLIFILLLFPTHHNLELHFLDVGQGDCSIIITSSNKTILIDGGNNEGYDNGENVVMPYLLKNGITKVDYMIASHADADHIGGLFYVLKNMEVKNVIISYQKENSENIEKLLEIVNTRKTNLILVNKGDRLTIEKGVFLDILWPDKENLISENPLNNNSIVCKLTYQNFSVLFTGDIEKIAEEKILQQYKNTKILNANLLKAPHHGSKTSSTQELLNQVNPKAVIIGVGQNNNFGHPNKEVLERYHLLRSQNLSNRYRWRNYHLEQWKSEKICRISFLFPEINSIMHSRIFQCFGCRIALSKGSGVDEDFSCGR